MCYCRISLLLLQFLSSQLCGAASYFKHKKKSFYATVSTMCKLYDVSAALPPDNHDLKACLPLVLWLYRHLCFDQWCYVCEQKDSRLFFISSHSERCICIAKKHCIVSHTIYPWSRWRWWGHHSSGNYAVWDQNVWQSSSSPMKSLCSSHTTHPMSQPQRDCPKSTGYLMLQETKRTETIKTFWFTLQKVCFCSCGRRLTYCVVQ